MKNIVMVTLALFVAGLFAGCGSNDHSEQLAAQQTQIVALQADLASIQTQLSSAQGQEETYRAGIDTAIASLTLTQNSLAQLTGQPAATDNTTALTTASNQILVLQSLADSLTANTTTAAADYAASTTSLNALTGQKAALQSQVDSLTSQIAAADRDNAAQTAQLVELNGQITTLSGQIDTLQATSNILSDQLAAAGNTIGVQAATIASLNASVTALNTIIDGMVATAIPIPLSASTLIAVTSTSITVTASFPADLNGESATFSSSGGSLASTSVVIVAGSASTTFSSASAGSFNIYAAQGGYAGGLVVSITTSPKSFAYFPTNLGIYAFTIDEISGALTIATGSPFAPGVLWPVDIAFTPSGQYAFVADSGSMSYYGVSATTISTYGIDSRTGALETIAVAPVTIVGHVQHILIDPSGTHLFTANFDENTLSVFNIDSASGALSPVSGSPFPADNGPVALAIDPAGTHLYVTTNAGGASTVSAYNVSASGSLTSIAGSPFARGVISLSTLESEEGAASLLIAIAADGNKRLYATDYYGRVLGYAIDATSGALGVPTIFDFSTTSGGQALYNASLVMDPSGANIYLTGAKFSDPSLLLTIAIDAASGAMTLASAPIDTSDYNKSPSMAMSPSKQYLYTVNVTGAVVAYDTQQTPGTPTRARAGVVQPWFHKMVTVRLP